jgi:multidrug efflux pump subunit AcrB
LSRFVLPRFFIDRPIFATVLSALITLAGALAVGTLPLSQYPPVAPPTIQIDCNYPGAGAQVVAETIAAPIEQQVNGVEDMLYMSSQSTSDGSYTLSVTFKTGTNLNMAQVRVQNAVALAMPNLPDVVRATGITTRKRSPELLLTVSLNSPEGRYDQLYLSNYAVTHLKDEISRLPGLSDVTIFGQRDFATRVWVDPEKLAARNLTATDVVSALRTQNAQVAAGHVGQPPVADGQPFQITLTTVGRLTDVVEFEDVVVKVTPDGKVVKIKDVARVELGAKSFDVSNRFDRKQTIGLAIFILSDANALEVSNVVKEKMAELAKDFPEGMRYEIGYDTTPFIRDSIFEVVKSLRDSVILVAIVVLVFLQSWRSALIPLAAVPVAIIGSFAAMSLIGFSLNNLTLFGLVLAVGIVVDDAIVVVEAVEHKIAIGLAPREATIAAMEEVSGPVIAVGAVLFAVFIPCAFLSGIVGQFFRQFALTVAIATAISTLNSLSLSPALCAVLLRPKGARKDPLTWIFNLAFGWFFWLFNRGFSLVGGTYQRAVRLAIRVPALVLIVYAGLIALGSWEYRQLPTGFIPSQDKGYLIASIQLPDAASVERTKEAVDKIAQIALETPGVAHTNAVAGNSFVLSSYGSSFGSMFIILDDFPARMSPDLYADKIAARLRSECLKLVPEAQVNIFGAPAVSGLGRAGGFRIMVEDRGAVGGSGAQRTSTPAGDVNAPEQNRRQEEEDDYKLLEGQTQNFIEKANQQKQVSGLFTVFKANSPQGFLDIDRASCLAHGIEVRDVSDVLQSTMGAQYVNDFNRFGRTWQVNVQAEQQFRNELEAVRRLKVRNKHGGMTPLGSVLKIQQSSGPLVITRYNMYPAAPVNGNVPQGVSTGDALSILEQLAEQELPNRMAFEWTELMFIEKQSRDTGMLVFVLAVVFVFLVLAALYESWALPLAVILVVPVCVVGSVTGIYLAGSYVDPEATTRIPFDSSGRFLPWLKVAGQDVNLFTQIGFVVLIGLACKNAILIVEFAKYKREEGASRREAVLAACKLRFRPILMTSVAFILGVSPLLFSHGAGAEMRKALGLAVFSGMIGVTVFGIFLTPVFFVLVDWLATGGAFRSRRLNCLSKGMLFVLRLEFVAPIAKWLGQRALNGLRTVTTKVVAKK